MLEFLKVSDPEQIKSVLKAYNPLTDTWIVSDLKSKQEVQSESILRFGYFTDDSILRVSDFWRLWVRRLEPTLQVVSSDFIKSLVQNFVDNYGDKLEILDSEVSTLNKAIQEFAPLLLHPSSEDILQEWFAQQLEINNQEKKWQRWYQVAKVCLNYIVNEEHAIDAKWSASYLQTLDLNLITWPRKMYVDLGSELGSVEMGLFKHISLDQEVKILTPEPIWKEKFPYLLNTYQENFGFGKVRESVNSKNNYPLKKEQFVRLSTQLAEVKFAVAQVRMWADQGVEVEKIAIIAADIEKYWPVLHCYLDEEGFNYKKDTVAQLNCLGDVQNLLAQLKNISSDVSWESLEKSLFSKEESTSFQFEKFKSLFYQLYSEDDLARDQKIKNLFYKKIDFSSIIDREEFLSFLLKIWLNLPQSNNKSDLFEVIFKDILGQSFNIKIKLNRWIQFLKNRLSHKEVTLKRSSDTGLYVLPLMSAQMVDVTHRIYIGLNDEFFYKKQSSMMSLSDSVSLKKQFDLAVDCSEESYLDFNLRWQSLSANENTLFTSAHLSFTSEPLNSALFFIENSPQSDVVAPKATRADELQQQLSARPDTFGLVAPLVSSLRLQQDKQGYTNQIKTEAFRQLAVGDIENYGKCSFKLLAGKGFKLRNYSQVAIDLDPRDKGNIAHALFEFCIGQMRQGEFNLGAVGDFLENERQNRFLYSNQDAIWGVQKSKFVTLAQKFNSFESERMKIFSVEVEKKFEIFFDLDNSKFTKRAPQNYFSFNMRIDRIDTHKKNNYCIIYDYKSSAGQIKTTNKWLSEFQFQMLLYLIALKLTLPENLVVKGSLYYLYKNFDLKKGLIDETIAVNEFLMNKKNSSVMSTEEIEQLDHDFAELMSEILLRLNQGEFSNTPYDLALCKDCDWSKLCRATHLM